MKTLFIILFIFMHNVAVCTDYYVSSTGNDANSGTSEVAAWQTLDKVNSTSFSAGDRILLKRGDTFYGKIVIKQSGTNSNRITISTYGTGERPIITGFVNVSSWTDKGGNIWESTAAVSALDKVTVVRIHGVNTAMGRLPNSGYYKYQSHSGTTSITSSSLAGTPDWTGAEAVVRTSHWGITKSVITSQSAGTLNFTDPLSSEGTNNYGFFIQNDIRTLDVQNEWYYNPATKKISIYSSTTPEDIQVSTVDTLIYLQSASFVTIDSIELIGANDAGIVAYNTSNVIIQNCKVSFVGGNSGIHMGTLSGTFTVQNNIVEDCVRGIGGNVDGKTNGVIKWNTVRRIGLISGVIKYETSGQSGITIGTANGLIEYNRVDSTGYNGINFNGNNTIVRRNFVSNTNLVRDDGGGIYYGGALNASDFLVEGNIVINAIGNNEGTSTTTDLAANGIYMDAKTHAATIINNSVYKTGGAGIFLGATTDCVVRGNNVFDNGTSSGFTSGGIMLQSHSGMPNFSNNSIKQNIFFSKYAYQKPYRNYNVLGIAESKSYGVSDSNYYYSPVAGSIKEFNVYDVTVPTTNLYNLSGWQSFSAQDAHSIVAPAKNMNSDSIIFKYNADTVTVTLTLDAKYKDVKNNMYNGRITLAPFTSAILMRIGDVDEEPGQVLRLRSSRKIKVKSAE